MKYSLLVLVLFVLGISLSNAQITVTSSHIATLGDTVFMWQDTLNGTTLDVGQAAGNQTWDFTGLQEHDEDGAVLEDPSTAPFATNYPDAEFVLNDLQEDSIHIFFDQTNNYLDIIGVVEYDSVGNPMLPENELYVRFMEFSSTFGDSYMTSRLALTQKTDANVDPDGPGPHILIDTIRIKFYFQTLSEIDAWGEVQLPGGNFMALRQNMITRVRFSYDFYGDGSWQPFTPLMVNLFGDTAQVDTNGRTLRWWSDNAAANFMLAEVELDSAGNPDSSVVWLDATPEAPASVEEFDASSIQAYPNPANNRMRIDHPILSQGDVVLIDQTGRMVLQKSLSGNSTTLEMASLPVGFYLMQVTEEGHLRKLQKVQVVR